jgi:predicted dinucleotide-binding enzyme
MVQLVCAVVPSMIIGFIGSGNIGSTLARLALDQGHSVVMSNSRGPATLSDLVATLGAQATAATAAEAAASGDIVVVTIPLKNYDQVPVEPLIGKIVIDTNNYYPERDGNISALDTGQTTSSQLLAAHLPGSRIVKVFNNIHFVQLAEQGKPAGTKGRRALPLAGDDAAAKKSVSDLVESFGFTAVDVGPLAEGRRFQPDTPAYGPELDAGALRAALSEAGTD